LGLDGLLLDNPKVTNLPHNSAKKPAIAANPFTIDDLSTPTHLQAKKDEVEDEFDAFFRDRTT